MGLTCQWNKNIAGNSKYLLEQVCPSSLSLSMPVCTGASFPAKAAYTWSEHEVPAQRLVGLSMTCFTHRIPATCYRNLGLASARAYSHGCRNTVCAPRA